MRLHLAVQNKKVGKIVSGAAPLQKQQISSFMNHIHGDWKLVDDKKISREFSS